ncbi:Eco57I restriction-modification methylase domain-containing protein [Carnobacterium alterfunditum]|uniref:Eco57I restriction-modification methylase domain-containing protein n=1 Tax=Carnobacterium alterfunditum TaxID=28230 RepID=UPI00359411A4
MLTMKSLSTIDELVKKLSNEKNKWMSLAIAIDLADEVLKVILPDNNDWQKQLSRDSRHIGLLPEPLPLDTFKNQKQVSWFNTHPESTSARSAFKLFYVDDCALESNFFWFSESATKQKIAAATEYSQNWEDSELTRRPEYKVGIDFFLTPDTNSLMVVLSNHQKLRVLELHGHLSNTQKLIFKDKLNGAAAYIGIENGEQLEFEPQRTIHTTLWNALQLKEVNKQFYGYTASHYSEVVMHLEKNGKKSDDAKQFSSRLLGRLLFIWFLRKMGVINESMDYFETKELTATEYYDKKLKLLFFETLNTEVGSRTSGDLLTPYLNGGLFEAKENDFIDEMIEFPEGFFTRLYNHFDEFNFTTDESSADFELIAVDPEMLGQVFESLLASQTDNDDNNERNNTGSFYTPREIVGYMVKETLRQYLYSKLDVTTHKGIDELLDLSDSQWLNRKSTSSADVWGVNSKKVISEIKTALDNFKVLDPAAGSGAFPMGMLQQLLKTYERIEKRFDSYKLKLSIIENNIFGVDNQPMAVEIARLRAWLSVIVDEKDVSNIKPLPNLDFKFIAANSLIKLEKGQTDLFADPELDVKLQELRNKYFNARAPHKKKEYQEKYYKLTFGQGNVFDDERTIQLKTFDPFKNRHAAEFFDPHVMFGVTKGFDAIIGNPPYALKLSHTEKNYLSKLYPNVPDFESSNYFISLSKELLKIDGTLSYIIPNTVLTNVHAEKYRKELLDEWSIDKIIEMSQSEIFDSAVVRNCILFLLNKREANYSTKLIQFSDKDNELLMNQQKLFDSTFLKLNIKSWLNLFYQNEREIDLINKIKLNSHNLADFTNISQGIISYDVHAGTDIAVKESKAYNATEKKDDTFKPMLKGADVKRYNVSWNEKNWISYGPWLANPRDPKYFTNPRLLFREITNPYIYCAYTEEEYYNNPSIINVTDFININPQYVLAIANSKMMNFYHKKNSPKSNKGSFPKMLIKDAKEMPIKIGSDEEIEEVINLVNNIIEDRTNVELSDKIDQLIYKIYDIDKEEIKIIEDLIPKTWLT